MPDPSLPQYPDYPGAAAQWPVAQARPKTITRAMQFMYAGAAMSLITLVLGAADSSAYKTAIRKAFPKYTQTQVNNAANTAVTIAIVAGLIGVGLWLWMAWANGRGRNWARVLSSVFFGIATLGLVGNLAQHSPAASLVVSLVEWLIGLAAILHLWNRQSSAYFHAPKP